MKKVVKYTSHVLLLVLSSLVFALGFNLFLLPHKLLSGGASGVSMILGYLTSYEVYFYYFLINVPILILGVIFLGGRFIVYSILSVLMTTTFMKYIPITQIADDPLLSSIFAGVLVGTGIGIAFKVGGSTGGLEVIAAIVSRYKDITVGMFITCVNTLIVVGYGYMQGDWNVGLASAICIYVSGRVVNFIYMENEKVTVHIITDKSEEIGQKLLKNHQRGITAIETKGLYSGVRRKMLMTVTTRYELVRLKEIVKSIDPNAFVNVTETIEVMGNFVRRGTKPKRKKK